MDSAYWTQEIWEALSPVLLVAIEALIGIVLSLIALYLPAPLRAFFEKKLRDDLEVAGRNAARAAIEGDWKHFDMDKDAREGLIEYVEEMMREGASEAIQRFKPSPQKLRQLALARINEANDHV